jgi:hypothetical protein
VSRDLRRDRQLAFYGAALVVRLVRPLVPDDG